MFRLGNSLPSYTTLFDFLVPAEALVCPEREGDGTEEAVGKVQETRQSPPMCSVQKCKDQHPQFGSECVSPTTDNSFASTTSVASQNNDKLFDYLKG